MEENTARLRRLTGLMQLGVEALKETDAIALLEACVLPPLNVLPPYVFVYCCCRFAGKFERCFESTRPTGGD